jgi:hypothetical protein
MSFERLAADREPTLAALHSYANAAISLSRVHGVAHPKHWHVSLKLRPGSLHTDPIPLPEGGALEVRLDLHRHAVVLETDTDPLTEMSMRDGATGTQMGEAIIAAAAELGLVGDYDRSRFESDAAAIFDPAQAAAVMRSLVDAHTVFDRHRAGLDGAVSPIQVWPHGFDLSFEWFGTRQVAHEEGGETTEIPSQLNLGFYPRGRAYFYSNPWPFDESLLSTELPHGAEWHTEGWKGSILYHDQIAGNPGAAAVLADFARAVYDAAAPTLTT